MTKVKSSISGLSFLLSKSILKLILIIFFAIPSSYADVTDVTYEISIKDYEIINDNVFEFDVMIKSQNENFILTSYQASIQFNQNIVNNGNITFFYIDGTSGLQNLPTTGLGVNGTDGSLELTFASLPGEEIINSNLIKIGRFRFENTNSFESSNPNLIWDFSGVISTILTGENFSNITNPNFHISEFGIMAQLQIISVEASNTTEANHGPEKTVDGLGYYDGDPDSKWAALPTPQFLIYDLGYEKIVSSTKFSFGNFSTGRIYQYSIFLSNDMLSWNEIVSNSSSSPLEWTVNEFSPQLVRYIKLLIIGNNQNDWATVWETQIWGISGVSDNDDPTEIAQPKNFELNQNYPNPFNPTTNIRFALPENGKVKLTIYNILGEAVAELLNYEMAMGIHDITFNAGNLASGIYVYRLDVENQFSDVRKMILMK